MICTRCGAIQRQETAKICHVCGMVFEPETASQAPGNMFSSTSEAAPQEARQSMGAPPADNFPELFPTLEQRPQEASIRISSHPTFAGEQPADQGFPSPLPVWEPPSRAPVSRPRSRNEPPGEQEQPPAHKAQEHAGASQAQAPYEVAASQPASFASTSRPIRQRSTPVAQLEDSLPPPSERPYQRSARSTRGPVPGALASRQRPRSRRVLLGLFIPLALVLIFVLVGLGVYFLITTPSTPEASAYLTYNDAKQQFSIQYPNVWTKKQLDSGVRFADVTNTAELSVTYAPNSANKTSEQYADQLAAKEGISTPDTKTFAGENWVVRSGIVTQTSGISQDIFIFVTLHKNVFFEIREVAPLDGYRDDQPTFMKMLQSLVLP